MVMGKVWIAKVEAQIGKVIPQNVLRRLIVAVPLLEAVSKVVLRDQLAYLHLYLDDGHPDL